MWRFFLGECHHWATDFRIAHRHLKLGDGEDDVRLSLIPRTYRFYDLFEKSARQLVLASEALTDPTMRLTKTISSRRRSL